ALGQSGQGKERPRHPGGKAGINRPVAVAERDQRGHELAAHADERDQHACQRQSEEHEVERRMGHRSTLLAGCRRKHPATAERAGPAPLQRAFSMLARTGTPFTSRPSPSASPSEKASRVASTSEAMKSLYASMARRTFSSSQ